MKTVESIPFFSKLLVFTSDFIFRIVSVCVAFLGIFSSQIRSFSRKRTFNKTELESIENVRNLHKHCVLFYCSSAGEYEQARPIASRLHEEGIFVYFIFFSNSGFKFATLRKEVLPFSLAPLDTRKNWKKILSVLKPNLTLIVRHELWPCFLHEASLNSNVYLINSSLKSKNTFNLILKEYLFHFIDRIWTVSNDEKEKILKHFSFNPDKISVVGDSKYDRVLERVHHLRSSPRTFTELSKYKKKLVVGSAWQADCEVIIPSFANLNSDKTLNWQLIIVPHQPTVEFILWIENYAQKLSLSSSRFSNAHNSETDIVIVDCVGQLFELYSACSLAFVGGAMHNEVHNVLEPAAFGLSIAFGPRYKNSHEATNIVSNNLARVIHNTEECSLWIKEHLSKDGHCENIEQFVLSNSGATDKMLNGIHSALSLSS